MSDTITKKPNISVNPDLVEPMLPFMLAGS